MPRMLEPDVARNRIKGDKPVSGKEQYQTLPADGCGHRGRITGLVIRGFPHEFASALIKGDNASAFRSSEIQENRRALNQRRTCHAKKAVRGLEFGFGINAPDLFAASKLKAMQHAFGAEGVNASFRNGWSRPGAIVKTELVLVRGWVAETPDGIAAFGIEVFDNLTVGHTLKENEFALNYCRATKAVANCFLPDHVRAFARPILLQISSSIDTISSWTQELWPITSGYRTHTTYRQVYGEDRNKAGPHGHLLPQKAVISKLPDE